MEVQVSVHLLSKTVVALTMIMLIKGHSVKNSTWITNERRLFHDLMDDYENYVRPVMHEKDPLNVKFGMALITVNELDEWAEILHTNAWLRYSWKDVQLTWEPAEYGGVQSIQIPTEKLWLPDIILYNNYKDSYDVAYRSLAVVRSTGDLLWIPPIHLSSICAVNLKKFPYDTQVCTLKFGSWTYNGNQVNLSLHMDSEKMDTSSYHENAQFHVVDTTAVREVTKYDCCPEKYISIIYTITLERKVTYATHMFMAPSVMLCLVLPAIFILPPEAKEKTMFGVGLLLANGMILTMLTSMVPMAHPTIPSVGMYHMTNMILIGISLALSAIVTNIWSKGDRGKKLPKFIQTFVLGILGRMLCVSRDEFMNANNNNQPSSTMRNLEILSDSADPTIHDDDDRENILRNFAQTSQRAEWRQFAVILDRLLFVVYIILVLITTLALATR